MKIYNLLILRIFFILKGFGNVGDVGVGVRRKLSFKRIGHNSALLEVTKAKLFGPVSGWNGCSLFRRDLLSL